MKATDIKNVACIGGGTIGSSWAVVYAKNGLNVKLYDINQGALDAARAVVERSAAVLKKAEVIDEAGEKALLAQVEYTMDIEYALKDADYIQESTPENPKVKHETVAKIEKYAPATAIVGSSTSRMKISEIASEAEHKERYIVTHPYNPPYLVPLVELSKGPDTSDETAETLKEFFESIGKVPILLKKESYGFICNRIQAVVDRELADLVGRGVTTLEDANKAITYGPGMRYAIMGPTMVYELGSATGIRGLSNNMAGSGINLLDDVAKWTVKPYDQPDYYDWVDEMRSHLPEEAGTTREENAAWRDEMLIGILRLHNMI